MELHHRRSIRLIEYDYSQAGAYFITLVAYQKTCLFGELKDGELTHTIIGSIVEQELVWLEHHFLNVHLDIYILMPNHLHVILVLCDSKTTQYISTKALNDPKDYPHGPAPRSIGAVLGQFKSRVTKRAWKSREWNGVPIWQRNYYEHIIRDEEDYNRIRKYIELNPITWENDKP